MAAAPRAVRPLEAAGHRIETSAAWQALDRASAEEEIVATAYDSAYGPHARVVQAALLYLCHPSSAVCEEHEQRCGTAHVRHPDRE